MFSWSLLFRPRMHLVVPLNSEGLSVYSTSLYQGSNISKFGNASVGRIVRAGGSTPGPLNLNPESIFEDFETFWR